MKEYDVIIIGGGVTGCAAAYEFSKYGFTTALLEKENDISKRSTKANSAIIHSGCDPKPGTLMAELNVRGNKLVHEIAKKLDVPFRETGSFVLAFSEEERLIIRHLYENSRENSVPAEVWEKERILEKEQSDSVKPFALRFLIDEICTLSEKFMLH
jgi:glycerol-3-phosphate dehydrogenase